MNESMPEGFSLPIYIIAIITQTLGDVTLTILASRIKSLSKTLSDTKDKKLLNVTIEDVQVIHDIPL